jgi:uncharacterized membrane protein YgcG
MNKLLSVLFALVVGLFAANALAYAPPPAPQSGWYVSDQTGKLSSGQIAQLNQKIERISRATQNEFGVLLLQNMGGENIEDVANATYKAWGVGKRGLDNGCLIVIAVKERKSRIETGKGVGGEVTDIQANDLLRRNLNPHLKAGDFYGGIDDTLNGLSSLMETRANQKVDPPPVPTTPPSSGGCDVGGVGVDSSPAWVSLFGFGIAGAVGIYIFRSRRRQRKEKEYSEAANRNMHKIDIQKAIAKKEAEYKAVTVVPPVVHVQKPIVVTPTPAVHKPKPICTIQIAHHASDAAIVAAAALAMEQERLREQGAADRRMEERDNRRREQDRIIEPTYTPNYMPNWEAPDTSSDDSNSGSGFGGGDSGGGGSSSSWDDSSSSSSSSDDSSSSSDDSSSSDSGSGSSSDW